ncbi:MAG: CPBP family intramembrane glutamic endopeptidase [Saprospiraceae bacterium]
MKLFTPSIAQDKEEKESYRWQVSVSVVLLFMVGALINIPFSRELKRLHIEAGQTDVHLNPSVFSDVFTIGLSSLVLGALLAFIGIWLSAKANLGAPVIARFFSRKPVSELLRWDAVLSSILLAVFVALVLLGLFELQKAFYPVSHKLARPAKSFYALVSFSAGISEEIMFRLGLMSFLIVLMQFFKRKEEPSNKMVWAGIFITAVFFGLIHLPLQQNFVDLTPFTIGVTMVGNFITGTTFGWIYWKRGLLVAILSHVAFDLVFHVLGNPYV